MEHKHTKKVLEWAVTQDTKADFYIALWGCVDCDWTGNDES